MNVSNFTADASSVSCFGGGVPPCHSATPGAVVGILSEDVNCFVATAAYGSPMAKQVSMLRQFRNLYLLPNNAGKKFVRWYYEHGPKAARFIAQNDSLRFAARVALAPAVAFAWVAVNYGFLAALAILTTLLALPILYVRRREFSNGEGINE